MVTGELAHLADLLSWTQMLGYPAHPARRWEPTRLRLRLFATAAALATHARPLVAHLAADQPWTDLVVVGIEAHVVIARQAHALGGFG